MGQYLQFFRDGWVVIAGAPIQFAFLVLGSFVTCWILNHEIFKHNLKLERELKDGYKEKLELRNADCMHLEESLKRQQSEAALLRQTIESDQQTITSLRDHIKRLDDGIALLQPQLQLKSLKADQLQAELNGSAAEIARKNAECVSLRETNQSCLDQLGRWRITQLGLVSQSAGFTVDIRYTEKDDDVLAKNVRGFFWSDFGTTPWKTDPARKIDWFKNPSVRGRIVIFSGHSYADALRSAFNEYALLRIAKKDGEPTFTHERFDCSSDKRDWMTADFTIVIFDKPSRDDW